jgi:hypothetical protein
MAGISGGITWSSSGEAVSIIGESGVFGGGESDGASAMKMAKLERLLMAGAKVVSPDWEEGRGRSRCSHHSPAGL